MRVLVTAGPTREYFDAVRYVSNGSTGAMGYALARAARNAGHEVVLVSGPVSLRGPKGVELISVLSAREMHRAVVKYFPQTDLVFMNAAVCDFRPSSSTSRKIKKTDQGLILELVPNPDILQDLGRRKKRQRLMGFALETHRGLANAREKLVRKNLDWIVLNSPSAIGASRMNASLLAADGPVQEFEDLTKDQLARRLLKVATAET